MRAARERADVVHQPGALGELGVVGDRPRGVPWLGERPAGLQRTEHDPAVAVRDVAVEESWIEVALVLVDEHEAVLACWELVAEAVDGGQPRGPAPPLLAGRRDR